MDRVRSSNTYSAYLFNVARRRYPSCNDKKSTRVPLSIVTYTRGIWTNSDIHLRSYLSLFRNLGDILCGDRSWTKRGQKWTQFRLESLYDEEAWERFFTLTSQSFASQLRLSWFKIVKDNSRAIPTVRYVCRVGSVPRNRAISLYLWNSRFAMRCNWTTSLIKSSWPLERLKNHLQHQGQTALDVQELVEESLRISILKAHLYPLAYKTHHEEV